MTNLTISSFNDLCRKYAANCRAKRDTTEDRTRLDIVQIERNTASETLKLDKSKAHHHSLRIKLAKKGFR